MGYQQHKELSPNSITGGVMVISDSRSLTSDESGKLICHMMEEKGHRISGFKLIKNNAGLIKETLFGFIGQPETQLVITSGGTGLSHRDLTVETVTALLEKKMDGFGELFRSLSYQEIGTGCIMSRAQAGIIQGKVIISLPGSVAAVRLAMEKIILPELGHMVREATR